MTGVQTCALPIFDQITLTITNVANNASQAYDLALEAGSLSQEGAGAVQEAVGEMGKISESVGHATGMIRDLDEKSNQISAIVNVIKEIADQTNLLALNAAIEAARAGEQGRGFAVVADEVRKLAERTTVSTQEIAKMIDAIQSSTQSSVRGMELSSEQVRDGVQMAARSGDSMNKIESSTHKVQNAVDEISSALREQSTASTRMAAEVQRVAEMTEKNNAAAQASAAAAAELEGMAANLKSAVDRFRV